MAVWDYQSWNFSLYIYAYLNLADRLALFEGDVTEEHYAKAANLAIERGNETALIPILKEWNPPTDVIDAIVANVIPANLYLKVPELKESLMRALNDDEHGYQLSSLIYSKHHEQAAASLISELIVVTGENQEALRLFSIDACAFGNSPCTLALLEKIDANMNKDLWERLRDAAIRRGQIAVLDHIQQVRPGVLSILNLDACANIRDHETWQWLRSKSLLPEGAKAKNPQGVFLAFCRLKKIPFTNDISDFNFLRFTEILLKNAGR